MRCNLPNLKKLLFVSALYISPIVANSAEAELSALQHKQWNHGAEDCQTNNDPAIEVFRQNATSFVLRQNKCLSYEAPFIYVLFGEEKILVLDTGATESAAEFPLYDTLMSLNKQQLTTAQGQQKEILVLHSHSHRDHYMGDSQFQNKDKVTVVAPNQKGIQQYFKFKQWPNDTALIDLGNRKLTIVPTPGHQEEAISIYDEQTKWLLTGDSFYPGAIFVKHWQDFKNSIARLNTFTKNNEVSLVLGSHIEMTKTPGEYYPIGSTYQPNEAPLALATKDLNELHMALEEAPQGKVIRLNNLVIEPMGGLQKTISNIARWFTQ